MKKTEKDTIDALVFRSFRVLVEKEGEVSAIPAPEYRLNYFKMGKREMKTNPAVCIFAASALFLFLVIPPIFWKDKPVLSDFVASAYQSGALDSMTASFQEALKQGGKALY